MTTLTDEPLLDTREVAALLGVHPMTIKRYVNAGALEVLQLPGGAFRFRRSDVEVMLRQRERPATAKAT